MKRGFAVLAGVLMGVGSVLAAEAPQPSIEIAICLDTSNSMDGLIESAKQKLWAVVTDMGTAKPSPKLKVALYQYGNDGLDPKTGWVEQLCPLTDDMDSVYGKLFALKTNGGTEYVARVMNDAASGLQWSADNSTLRMIVIAGNEPATQDSEVKLEAACQKAASKGIVVNTIFCGAEAQGRSTGWADAARLADGRYSAIDQNGGTVVVQSPYDKELAEMGVQLNTTYVAYGAAGQKGAANQAAQDANAASMSAPSAAGRAAAKAQAQYSNGTWDLVDAVQQKQVDLDKVKADELPAELKDLKGEERAAYIENKSRQRKELREKINQLNAQREKYVKEEMAKSGLSDKNAFDTALRKAIHEQAAKKGIAFAEQKQ